MSLKKPHKWECFDNHLPEWVCELDAALYLSINNPNDEDRLDGIVDRYNELIDLEQDKNTDPSELYGIENEKQCLAEEAIAIFEKYKDSAYKLQQKLNQIK